MQSLFKRARIAEVVGVVCEGEGVTLADMKSDSRVHRLAHPRQIAMFLARDMTPHSYPAISRWFGDRDHTTVIFAYRKVGKLEEKHEEMSARLHDYRRKIYKLVAARTGMSSDWSPPSPAMEIAKPDHVTVSLFPVLLESAA